MYLHLGQNIVVPESSVIGIFDMDNSTSSHITRKYLNEAQKSGRIVSAPDDLPRSFVVCQGDGGTEIHLSQLASVTLARRGGQWLSVLRGMNSEI